MTEQTFFRRTLVSAWQQSVGLLLDRQLEAQRPSWHRLLRKAVPATVFEPLNARRVSWLFSHLSDRRYLHDAIIPLVARRGGRILFVGCQNYTWRYPALLQQHGGECWTIDIDPEVARWGAPGRHVTCGIEDAPRHLPQASFNTVIVNGLFGFGVDTLDQQNAAVRAVGSLLKRGGWLIIGWDTDRSASPSSFTAMQASFQPAGLAGLPAEQRFDDSVHVYNTFVLEHPIVENIAGERPSHDT